MPNGRCKMHGGKAGRKPIHGRYSKALIQERRRLRLLVKSIQALLHDAGSGINLPATDACIPEQSDTSVDTEFESNGLLLGRAK